MSNIERDYLEAQIATLMGERAALPQRFEVLKAQQEAKIEAFLAEAGVLPRVQAMRAEVDNLRRAVQSRADNLTGRIEALQAVMDAFHTVKVPAGTTFDAVSGEPLPAPLPPPEEESTPSPTEVYEDEDDEGDGVLAEEAAREEADLAVSEDELAEAIENAPNEEAVRALLARYRNP